MRGLLKYYSGLQLLICFLFVQVQIASAQEKQNIYTDRTYCLSGDTVWFKVWMPKDLELQSNVVHLQLGSLKGKVISTVSCKSINQWAEGYLAVPDSLSSGNYVMLAFLNQQRKEESLQLDARNLIVYNRFDESLTSLDMLPQSSLNGVKEGRFWLEINTTKKVYSKRERVNAVVELNENNILNATISARSFDPLADKNCGVLPVSIDSSKDYIPDFAEKDGVLISGRVLDENNKPQNGILTLLSISSEPPYFDYYLTDEHGAYNFFLPKAEGTADIILQTLDREGKNYKIVGEQNYLRTKQVLTENKVLTAEQSQFVQNVVQANFIEKLFNPITFKEGRSFEMPARYNMPFYGNPSKRVIPAEYYDLPDFKEISRELLQGVQYRSRNGESTIRMLNADRGRYFENEPLRLLNGIPVFKNTFFSSLKSTEISYIDIVEQERVFGDLTFNGVFAVSLHDKSNSWLAQQPNIFQIRKSCLQVNNGKGKRTSSTVTEQEPDVRQNFLWKKLSKENKQEFSFQLSDMKGKVIIVVEGVSKNGDAFKTSKIIEVN